MAKKSAQKQNSDSRLKNKSGIKASSKEAKPSIAEPKSRPNSKKQSSKKLSETKTAAKPSAQKQKRQKKAHATRPTAAEKLKILERQNLVMDLKLAGISFRKIAVHLKSKNIDASVGTVYADYVASLERLQETNIDKTELLVTQELEKIEEWEGNFASDFKDKTRHVSIQEKIAIGNYFVTLQNQRDKFLAISKAKKSEVNANDALAALLGRSPEEFPDESSTG